MRVLATALILLLASLLFVAGCGEEEKGGAPSENTSETIASSGPTVVTETTASAPDETATVALIPSGGGERVEVEVEIADDIFEVTRGLMYRTELAEDQGMLFVFSDEQQRSFWMKNTFIPLSIAYIDSEGRIVDIQKMEPVNNGQNVPDAELPRYVSAEPAMYALEVNQGFYEERGIEVGDTAEIPDR